MLKGTRNQYLALIIMVLLFIGIISLIPELPTQQQPSGPTAQQILSQPSG